MHRSVQSILLLLLFSLPLSGWAQRHQMQYRDRLGDSVVLVNTAEEAPRTKRPAVLTSALSGGFRLNSNGWGLFMDKGFLYGNNDFGSNNRNKFFQARVIELSFSEIKHPKEIKANAALPGLPFQPGAYILGKVNNFYQANLGYGYRRLIAGKPDPGTVSIHWTYLGGFSGGLLKPYYLNIYNLGAVKYSEDVQQEFLTPGRIMGKAGFSKGLNEIKFVPGIFLKTGLHFDFASQTKGLMALETGAYGSFYFQKVLQMVGQDPKQFFLNFYVSIQFGGKW